MLAVGPLLMEDSYTGGHLLLLVMVSATFIQTSYILNLSHICRDLNCWILCWFPIPVDGMLHPSHLDGKIEASEQFSFLPKDTSIQ